MTFFNDKDIDTAPSEAAQLRAETILDGEIAQFHALVIYTFQDRPKLLEILKKKYIEAPSARVGCDPTYPYFREGQNDLIRTLINIIEEAQYGSI